MNTIQKKKKLFASFVEKNSIQNISGIPLLIALIIVMGWVILKQINLVVKDTIWDAIILSIAAFSIGFTGILYIYKKEMPGIIASQTIKGWWAVFSGILLVVFFWGGATVFLILSVIGQ